MTILRDFIDAQHLHCERLTSIILHHAAQPEPVTVQGGNTADLADLAEMRDILDGADYAPTPDGLHGMAEDLDCRHNEVASAKDGLMLIVSHDDIENLTLAELVTAAGEALDSLHRERDGAIAAIAKARQTISAAMGVSPITSIGVLSEDVADTMSALRRALGCPDGASAGQIVAEAALLRKEADEMPALRDEAAKWSREHWRVHGELSILAAELARIDRAIAPLWTGDPSDCIGKRVEAVAKAAHVRAETVGSLYDKIRERDAQIAALTPGPWVRLGDMDPGDGEKVLMHDGVVGSAPWLQLVDEATAKYLHATYLWRRLPVGLLTPPKTSETVTP